MTAASYTPPRRLNEEPAPKGALAGLPLQPAQATGIVAKAGLTTDGDLSVLDTLASVIDTSDPHFNISTP